MNKSLGTTQIAFVTPSMMIGGRERVLAQLINYFSQKQAVTVHLVLFGRQREIFFKINENVTIHKPEFLFDENSKPISTIKTLFFLRRKIKELKIDKIVSFEEVWNCFVLLATIGLKTQKYISNRNNPYYYHNNFHKVLSKLLYPQAKVLIAQTQFAKSIYQKRYRLKKCVVIGNPIPRIILPDVAPREKIIISVGRLMKSKNHDRLIRIFSKTKNKDWKLIIVGGDFGDQDNSQKLIKLIREFGLEDQIHLTGAIENVNHYLLKSSIFAFTSSREGFPNVIGEAMAAGLPVISYDCIAGPSEMIDDGYNGFLIPVYNDKLFIEKLEYLMNNKETREVLGQNSIKRIARFDSEIICEKFHDLIFSDINPD